jgi:hypothetical protein
VSKHYQYQPVDDSVKAAIRNLADDGLTQGAISRRLNIHILTVRKYAPDVKRGGGFASTATANHVAGQIELHSAEWWNWYWAMNPIDGRVGDEPVKQKRKKNLALDKEPTE